MNSSEFAAMAERYRKELYGSVLPFWLDNSQDKEFGGYFYVAAPEAPTVFHMFSASANWSGSTVGKSGTMVK